MPSPYSQVEVLLKNRIASGEFSENGPGHGAINILAYAASILSG
jgi:hypothetical protein